MATHSSVLAWRIPGTGEPGGLRSTGSHRVGHNYSDLAAAAAGQSAIPPSLEGVGGFVWEDSHGAQKCNVLWPPEMDTEVPCMECMGPPVLVWRWGEGCSSSPLLWHMGVSRAHSGACLPTLAS